MERNDLKALELIRRGRVSAAGLGAALGVSWRTTIRLISRLRRQGYRITAVREGRRWWYRLENGADLRQPDDPLLGLAGMVGTGLRDGSVHHDHYLYGAPRKRREG